MNELVIFFYRYLLSGFIFLTDIGETKCNAYE